MNAPSTLTHLATHLATALAGVALGWFLATANGGDSAPGDLDLGSGDPAAALESILTVDDPLDRAARLAAFFERTDPAAALELHAALQQKGSGLHVDEMSELLFASWWARSAPETAFRNPLDPPWADRHPWMRTVLGEWAKRDPVAAARAVQEMPGGQLKGRVEGARTVVDEWLKLEHMPEPSALIGVMKQLEPLARSGAITHVLESMIQSRGIEATLDFVRSVPPDDAVGGNVQHEFLARTAVVLIDHDIDRAVAWAREQGDGPNASGVNKHLAYYWGLRDGRAAIEWALALPDQPGKSTIVKRAWISFSRKHREDAIEWISTRAPDPMMRGAYIEYIRSLAETEPESALALANRSPEGELRHAMLAAAGEGWMKRDPDAATAWLTGAGLPEDLEHRVRARRPSP